MCGRKHLFFFSHKYIGVDSEHQKKIGKREEVLTTGLEALVISQMSKLSKTSVCNALSRR